MKTIEAVAAMSQAIPYAGSGDLLSDARTIIDGARKYAYSAVNTALVQRNWLLGKRISEEELRAEIEAQKTIFYLQQAEEKKSSE